MSTHRTDGSSLDARWHYGPGWGAPLVMIIGLLLLGFAAEAPPADAQPLDYLSSVLWSGASGVQADGELAFCGYANGLIVFDISDPAAPAPLARCYCPGGAGGLQLAGELAVLRDYG
ncbi:MAG: hypothetical protein GF330_10030, partial [Candidatus Eisenbacteria bacterium]|nr:hypothetical protein [Candidatus Eisenbacteria bacterium]